MTDPAFRPAENGTSYQQTSGTVVDSQPRIISNLIVDQTANNPAAVLPRRHGGAGTVISPGLDGVFGTADDTKCHFIPNVSPDEGLSAPFNSWMTFFGQFFDHGLDLVTKGSSGTVFIPLQPATIRLVRARRQPTSTNFMVLTRAPTSPAPMACSAPPMTSTSRQHHLAVRRPEPDLLLAPFASGVPARLCAQRGRRPCRNRQLITNRDLGADGKFGTADDGELGGMATWAVVKAQARDILGINLTDADVNNVPLLATDAYGNFIRGANGLPQVVMKGADGIGGTADDVLVEGNPAAPISLANAVSTGHEFLDDIAHNAASGTGGVLQAMPTPISATRLIGAAGHL